MTIPSSRVFREVIVFLLLVFLSAQAASSAATEDLSSLIQRLKDFTVKILTYDARGNPLGLGSGFFIGKDGRLITNAHVIEGAGIILIQTHDRKVYPVTRIVKVADDIDIAWLIARIPPDRVALLPPSGTPARVGEKVYVMGNPQGLEWTLSDGIVSAIRDGSFLGIRGKVVQITAPISRGSSGGPVVNTKGEVIGVACLLRRDGQNLNFAISVESISRPIRGARSTKDTEEDNSGGQPAEQFTATDWVDMGRRQLDLGRFQDAIVLFTRAVEMDSKCEPAYYYRARSYFALNELERAREDLDNAIQLNPTNANAYKGRGFVYSLTNRFDKAIEDFGKALEYDPKDGEAYKERGIAYTATRNLERALIDYNKATELIPKDSDVYYYRGRTYVLLEKYREGITDFGTAIELNPQYAEAYSQRGFARQQLGFYQDAITDFSKAIQLEPESRMEYCARGLILARLRNHRLALDDFHKCIELNPQYTPAYLGRAIARAQLDDFRGGLKDADKAIELDSGNPAAYRTKGLISMKIGDHYKAIDNFNIALKIDPNNEFVHTDRGFAYFDNGKYDLAISDLNAALRTGNDPDNRLEAYLGLAICFYQLKDLEKSKSYYRKVVEIEPRVDKDWRQALEGEKGAIYSSYQARIIGDMIKQFSISGKANR